MISRQTNSGFWRLKTSYFFETDAGRLRRKSLAIRSRCFLANRTSSSRGTSTRRAAKNSQSRHSTPLWSDGAVFPLDGCWWHVTSQLASCCWQGTSSDNWWPYSCWHLTSLELITRSVVSSPLIMSESSCWSPWKSLALSDAVLLGRFWLVLGTGSHLESMPLVPTSLTRCWCPSTAKLSVWKSPVGWHSVTEQPSSGDITEFTRSLDTRFSSSPSSSSQFCSSPTLSLSVYNTHIQDPC